jgi:hypothetical protein
VPRVDGATERLAVDERHETLAVLAPRTSPGIRSKGLAAGEHYLADGQRERLLAQETVAWPIAGDDTLEW